MAGCSAAARLKVRKAGGKLDLKAYARELVDEMQLNLGTRLQWFGMAHYDTDEPHIHLLVRGKDERGGDLVTRMDHGQVSGTHQTQ